MSEHREHFLESGPRDADELKEVLAAVSEGLKDLAGVIPGLIKNTLAAIYSEESAKEQARAVATYYKTLRESGMPEEMVQNLVLDYVVSYRDIVNIIQSAVEGKRRGRRTGEGEPSEEGSDTE